MEALISELIDGDVSLTSDGSARFSFNRAVAQMSRLEEIGLMRCGSTNSSFSFRPESHGKGPDDPDILDLSSVLSFPLHCLHIAEI